MEATASSRRQQALRLMTHQEKESISRGLLQHLEHGVGGTHVHRFRRNDADHFGAAAVRGDRCELCQSAHGLYRYLLAWFLGGPGLGLLCGGNALLLVLAGLEHAQVRMIASLIQMTRGAGDRK